MADSLTIHDRVKVIKNLTPVTAGGGDDDPLPKHGGTHAKTGSDPIPQEVDGIPVDLDGIVDGQAVVFNESENKLEPGAGGGGGEVNTSSNAGPINSIGLALAKVGADLPFKSLKAGANVTLNATATEVEIEVNGVGDAESIRTIEVLDDIPTDSTSNLMHLLIQWYQNFIKWSEDISHSPWVQRNTVAGGPNDFIADSPTTFYDLTQALTVLDGTKTQKIIWTITNGNSPYYLFRIDSTTLGQVTVSFNVSTGVFTNKDPALSVGATANGSTWTISIWVEPTDNSMSARVFASDTGGTVFSLGDGTTVSFTVDKVQVYEGTIAQNHPYIKTEATAQTGIRKFKALPSASSSLLENLATGAFETAVPDVEFRSPEQHGGIYGLVIRRYTAKTITVAGDQLLFTDTDINKLIGFGGPISDNDGTPFQTSAGGYSSAGSASGIIMQESTHNVVLSLGSSEDDVGDSLLVWVDYNKD